MPAKRNPDWNDIFPKTDLSEHLQTRQLLDAWYLLAGRNVAVLVDTVKPRLSKLFAFGRFGTFQQLLYDVETYQEAGRSGLRPVYYRRGIKYTPLKDQPYIFEDTPSQAIEFDPARKRVALQGVQCYDPELKPGGRLDMEVALRGDGFRFACRGPRAADHVEIELELYPLYTDYRCRGWRADELIDYYCWNSRYHNPAGRFTETARDYVLLRDRHGRAPALEILARGAVITIRAFCDEKRNDAHRLRLVIKGKRACRAELRLKTNAITVQALPIIAADKPHAIEIACRHQPAVLAGERKFGARRVGPGRWRALVRVPHGVARLRVESPDGISDRQIAAVGDIPRWVEKMGWAAAAVLWPKGPAAGLMPQMIDVKRLTGKIRGSHGKSERSIVYCSHNPRALMIIAAAARATGDRQLLARAWDSIRAMARLAYRHPDGALVLPIGMYADGTPCWIDSVRPSDPAIAIRSILMVRSVFLEWGERKLAEEALGYARGFALALLKMAGPEGQLEARYRYPTLELTRQAQIPGRGTVNNWVTNIRDLAEILELRNDPLGARLRALCVKHADLLINSRPSILRLAGGGENGPNNSDALNEAAGFFLVNFIETGDRNWARKAQDAFLMAALNNTIMHIDQPQNFCFTFDWTESIWHDGPINVMSKGGMHDLTSCDVGLALAHRLDDDFARDMCAYQFLARLVDGVFANGAVLNRVTAMPNFQYVKTDFTETLNFGAVGVMAFYYGLGFRRLAEFEAQNKYILPRRTRRKTKN